MTLTDVLQHHCDHFPDRPALEYEGTVTSWGALLDGVRLTAGALKSAGVGAGDIVAVLLHNSDRFLELMHAISHLGAVFMPLNWRLAPPELSYILNHAGAAAVISEPELEPLLESVSAGNSCKRLRLTGESDAQWISLDDLRAVARPVLDPFPAADGDLHRLMYTSGTTSRPKGVMISQGNLLAKNAAHLVEFGMTADAIGLVAGPLYHVGALDITTTTLMYAGAVNHVLRRFEPVAVLDAIESHGITDVWFAPVMINVLVNHPDIEERDLSSVRLVIDGGEKMPLTLIERVLRTFPNAWFADAYGLTETVSGDTVLDKGRTTSKLGSVGKPVLHTAVRVVNGEGRDQPPGQAGEVVLRGPKVFMGYWRDEKATAAAIQDGWFRSGDLGYLDKDGYLFIVDRVKDVIISGGENIASSEVERVLYEHPAILEAAVVARPDERWLEVPVAYVVLRSGAPSHAVAELPAHCSERLARFKVPREFRVVEALPRNPSGKVLKRELRDLERAKSLAR